MAGLSDIEWTEATWNPVAGCAMVKKYAGTTRKSGGRAVWTGRVNVDQAALIAPLEWKKPMRIFVNSMSDLFQDTVPISFVRSVWSVMKNADWHTYQILTKRPDRMRDFLLSEEFPILKNVWLGTSVESQAYTDRIGLLRETPAHVRFVSFEPLLGPIVGSDLSSIHWAIVGGESGPHARPMEAWWVQELRDQCIEQNVAFFFKQWGGTRKKSTGRMLQGRTWDQYPVSA
jgi:protein gp37